MKSAGPEIDAPPQVAPQGIAPHGARLGSWGKSQQLAVRQAEVRLRLLTTRVASLIWSTDADLRITSCAAMGMEGLELPAQKLVGQSLVDSLPEGEAGRAHLAAHRRVLAGETVEYETTWLGRTFEARLEPLREHDGFIAGAVGAGLDVTALKQAQDDLQRTVFCDGLTGLPNRTVFLEALGRAAERSDRPSGCSFSVLLLNLDGFKGINDACGHAGGDQVLVEVARRLGSTVRQHDLLARFGGDEFTVLLETAQGGVEAEQVARRMLAALAEPMSVADRDVVPRASVGISVAGRSPRPEVVLRDAEIAMFRAKVLGKARCQVFDGPFDARSMSLLRVEVELRRALEREEFRTHYAPTVAVKGGRVSGFEVLLWRRAAARR